MRMAGNVGLFTIMASVARSVEGKNGMHGELIQMHTYMATRGACHMACVNALWKSESLLHLSHVKLKREAFSG